jgi:hypothetical protein
MTDPAQAAVFAARFEPVTFFPINPKQYLERCALWQDVPPPSVQPPPFDDKNNWGGAPGALVRNPQIPKGMIAALATELAGGKEWLGSSPDFGVRASDQQMPTPSENFLEFVGWEPPVANASHEVTATSDNNHAALQPPEYVTPLQGVRHWYYVEYLNNQDLAEFVNIPNLNSRGLDVFKGVVNNPSLSAPQVLIYHLFYPLHQETLEGCENAGEGRLFGTYAGEWHCIALLLDSSGSPQFIGLTSRNVGSPALVGVEEPRVGMTVSKWTDAQLAPGGDIQRFSCR